MALCTYTHTEIYMFSVHQTAARHVSHLLDTMADMGHASARIVIWKLNLLALR